MENRESIKSKISKLLNMTEEHGASESEAMVAASMAAKLMSEHDIQLSELVIKNSKSIKGGCNFKAYGTTRLGQGFSNSIGEFCDCKVWRDCNEGVLVYFGLPHDVEIANFLFDMLSNTVSVEIDKYKNSQTFKTQKFAGTNGKTLVNSFICGIESRIREKLQTLIQEKKNAMSAATGTGLVVMKNQVVNKDFAELNMKLRTSHAKRVVRSSSAYSAGESAGNNVNIISGITGKAQGKLT